MSEKYLLNGFWSKTTNLVFLGRGIKESEQYEHTLVFNESDGKLILDEVLRWNSVALNTTPDEKLIIICSTGEYFIKNGEEYIEQGISAMPVITASSYFRKHLYICGMSSKVYKFTNDNKWELDVKGLEHDDDFTDIHGCDDKLIIVGFGGVCYVKKENHWYEEPLPTNQNLSCVFSHNQMTLIAGQSGTILIGTVQGWTFLKHKYPLEDFWHIAYFNHHFYITGNNTVYLLDKIDDSGEIIPVYEWDLGEHGISSDMFVEQGNRDRLWVVAEKGLAYLESGEWTKLI